MLESIEYANCGKFVSDGEWKHPDRMLDSYTVIFVTKGRVCIQEEGEKYLLQKDDVIVLSPHKRHRGYQSTSDVEYFWLHFRGDLAWPNRFTHTKIENPYNVSLYFRQLLNNRILKRPPEGMDYLTRLILIELYTGSVQPNMNRMAESIAAWIRANCHIALSEAMIADHFGYNADYLNRMFKANFFKTIKQYINEKRMEHIKTLMLSEDLTLAEIAAMSGFSEYKYFLKFFKYHEGITPTDFCKQYAKIHINTR